MIAGKYQAYPEYKNSGVEWLGKIPTHWNCVRLKYVATLKGIKLNPETTLRYVGMENIESKNGKYLAREEQKPEGLSTSFDKEDVLFGKLRPYLAKSWLAEFSGICSSEFLVLKSVKVYPKFLNYYTLVDEFINQVDSSTYGSKMPRASWDFISLMGISVPPHKESRVIANFLDHETAKIDTLIEKQKTLIKLLKEKRQAVISHAVTKGLNPDAPMKDSGVEWLGKVPEHWMVSRISLLFKESSARATCETELHYPVLSVSIHHGISDKELNENDLDRKVVRSEDKSLYKVVHNNDLTYNMMRAWQGGFGASKISGLISPAYVVCKPRLEIDSYYFELTLRTPNAVTELKRYSRGITDFRLRLYWDEFKNICVPVPPNNEVEDILIKVQEISDNFNHLVSVVEKQIDLLKERRTALISAAVTGKIDVRNWQPPTQATQSNQKETSQWLH